MGGRRRRDQDQFCTITRGKLLSTQYFAHLNLSVVYKLYLNKAGNRGDWWSLGPGQWFHDGR